MVKTIMVVDDNPDVTDVIKQGLRYLYPAEYKVICVDSGKNCLRLLKDNQIPDLILLDIIMPGMNGWDVFAKVKENPKWREIPIVFLTAQTDPYSEGFGKISADDYIEKPFDMQELKKRIDEFLQRK